jgi:hypothetical protein
MDMRGSEFNQWRTLMKIVMHFGFDKRAKFLQGLNNYEFLNGSSPYSLLL